MTEAKHTMFAQKAIGLAEMFQSLFGVKPVGATVKYRAELASPDGPSTGGGKQALQAVKLTPIEAGTTLVVGHANQVDGTAELRTYEYLTRMQQQRFKGAELPLDRPSYDEFLTQLKNFFANNRMRVNVVASPPAPAVEVPAALAPKASANTTLLYVAIGVGVAVLAALMVLILRS